MIISLFTSKNNEYTARNRTYPPIRYDEYDNKIHLPPPRTRRLLAWYTLINIKLFKIVYPLPVSTHINHVI